MINANTKPDDGSLSSFRGIRRLAVYGGSFDPLHNGHFAIAKGLVRQFRFDKFVFVPAFQAPHKTQRKATSAFHRFAMLALATAGHRELSISPLELEMPERPYSVETHGRLLQVLPSSAIFFVMGADSWRDIRTWREWERVLTMTNHIVVTRPGYPVTTDHVTDAIRDRTVDLRRGGIFADEATDDGTKIYFSDAVHSDASASRIRTLIAERSREWRLDVPEAVANYIEKYELYK